MASKKRTELERLHLRKNASSVSSLLPWATEHVETVSRLAKSVAEKRARAASRLLHDLPSLDAVTVRQLQQEYDMPRTNAEELWSMLEERLEESV